MQSIKNIKPEFMILLSQQWVGENDPNVDKYRCDKHGEEMDVIGIYDSKFCLRCIEEDLLSKYKQVEKIDNWTDRVDRMCGLGNCVGVGNVR